MTVDSSTRLFTPRFLIICAFNFTVFLSAFQLLPTAPIRILDLGGSTFVAGLFVGLLTYASAFSAPFTGALADRLGLRRTLIVCSLAILVASIGYAVTTRPRTMLILVVVHGVFWSGLLTSAGAYAMSLMPPARRAEGIGYWGISTVLAVAVAPSVGLWIYHHGWFWLCVSCAVLNLTMGMIAWRLPEPHTPRAVPARSGDADAVEPRAAAAWHDAIEWRVTLASVTLFLVAFGYGGVMSFVAVYAREQGVGPPGLYFTLMALVMLVTRPISGPLADRFGPGAVLVPCILVASLGYALLAAGGTRPWLVASALTVGLGFGSAYPAHAAFVLRYVDERRRAAALGGILAALDTGIGSGSMTIGWIIQHSGYRVAYGAGAVIALFAAPYFLFVAPRVIVLGRNAARQPRVSPSSSV
jgi:MFS family permease